MTYSKGINMWFSILTIIYLLLLIIIILLAPRTITSTNLFEITVLALATFRLSHLISYDKILKDLRELIKNKKSDFFQAIHELIICPWCISMWSALILIGILLIHPLIIILHIILALSAIASIIQNISTKYLN